MGEDNVWLAGRRQEHNALGRVIVKLEATRLADGTTQAVRGAGVGRPHRHHHWTDRQPAVSRGNPDNLRRAAVRKSAAAQTRAEQGLREMLRRAQPITFRASAQVAGVSLDFLDRHPELRGRVEQLRAQQQNRTPTPPERADPDQPSSVLRTLTAQLAELTRRHRDEVHTPEQALAAAHGENLELRRRLGHRGEP